MVWQALPGLFYTYIDPDMELTSSLKDSASFYEKCYIETHCEKQGILSSDWLHSWFSHGN